MALSTFGVFLYLGPGLGIGSLIALAGIGIALLFVLYSFIFLPIKKALRKKKEKKN